MVLLATVSGCAWFEAPPALGPGGSLPQPTASPVSSRDTTTVGDSAAVTAGPADTVSVSGAPADTASASAGAPAEALPREPDRWNLNGQNLHATTTGGKQILHLDQPVITHGALVINAAKGLYLVDQRLGRLSGEVTFTEDEVVGRSDFATYDRDREVLTARGNVAIQGDSLYVTSERADYDRGAGLIHMSGRVRGASGERRMTSERGTWDRERDHVLLEGHVRLNDAANDSWVTGDRVDYDRVKDLARVTGTPRLVVRPESGGTLAMEGTRLWLDSSGSTRAGGDVRVTRGLVTGYADSAAFFRDRHLAVMYGSPRVEETGGTMLGDTLLFHFDEREVLERVDVHGNAFVRYAPVDSSRAGEVSIVQGDSLRMYFVDRAVDRIAVFCGDKSSYTPPASEDREHTGTNVARGDTITIHMEDAEISRVVVSGHAEGVYTFGAGPAAGTDSLAAPVFPPAAPGTAGTPADSTGTGFRSAVPDSTPPMRSSEGPGPPGGSGTGEPGNGDAPAPGRERVEYRAKQVTFVLGKRTVDLREEAQVVYEPLTLTAGKVLFHADKRYLEAEETPVLVDRSQGDQREVVGTSMEYNLGTREGVIDNGRTRAEEGFVYADRLRQIGDDDFLAGHGNSTTCDLVDKGKKPHFHFGSKKMRIYLKDRVVAKPVTLYIRDIPIFAVPFYVFSIRRGRQSGFLTPDFDFGLGSSTGRFVNNFGYYWATNDYMDLTFKGSYQETPSRFVAEINTHYAKRYLLSGRANYRQTIGSTTTLRDISADHSMTLGEWQVKARAEFRDEGLRSTEPISNNLHQRLDRFLLSDLSASRRFGFGASLNLAFSRRKDLGVLPDDGVDQEIVRETLPNYSFALNSRPLGRKPDRDGKGGRLPFLSTVRLSFRSSGSTTRTETEDTVIRPASATAEADTLFGVARERRSRASHVVSVSDTRKLFGAFNVGPSFTASENWTDREFSAVDTTRGFRRALTWSTGFSGGATAYGTFPGIGPVQAIRHTVSPNATFNFQPEFRNLTYADSSGFRRNRYPGISAGKRKLLSLSVDNRFQAKIRTADGIKRVDLFNWSLRSSFDFLAERKGWRDVTSVVDLNRILGVNLSFNSSHDPYRQFRFNNFQVRGAFGLRGVLPGADAGESVGGNPYAGGESALDRAGGDTYEGGRVGSAPVSSKTLGWNAGFTFSYLGNRLGDSIDTQASMNSNLSLQITRNWSVAYHNTWRITEGELAGEGFSLRRDLHCWEATFSGNRLGDDISFYFRINVKGLQDIKYEQGRNTNSGIGGLTGFLR